MGLMDILREKLTIKKKIDTDKKNKEALSWEIILKVFDLLKNFSNDEEEFFAWLEKSDLEMAFLFIKNCDRVKAYVEIFHHIPDAYKYDLFINIYSNSECKFHDLTDEIINKIQEIRPSNITGALIKKADSNSDLVLYRGESERSSKIEKAMSWSLMRGTAVWYAKRSGDGCLYSAKANLSNVITYIEARGEEEILIRYKDIKEISKEESPKYF